MAHPQPGTASMVLAERTVGRHQDLESRASLDISGIELRVGHAARIHKLRNVEAPAGSPPWPLHRVSSSSNDDANQTEKSLRHPAPKQLINQPVKAVHFRMVLVAVTRPVAGSKPAPCEEDRWVRKLVVSPSSLIV